MIANCMFNCVLQDNFAQQEERLILLYKNKKVCYFGVIVKHIYNHILAFLLSRKNFRFHLNGAMREVKILIKQLFKGNKNDKRNA